MSASSMGSMSGIARFSTPSSNAMPTPFIPERRIPAARDRQRASASHKSIAHDNSAPLALLAHHRGDRALARQRPLLSVEPGQRRPPEPRSPHSRGFADRHQIPCRFHRRRHLRVSVGLDLHRGAVDDRRRADPDNRQVRRITVPGFLVITAVIYAAITSSSIWRSAAISSRSPKRKTRRKPNSATR